MKVPLRLLARLSPRAAAAVADLLFRAPPPRTRPRDPRERAVLAAATRFDVEVDGNRLAAWRWGEGPRVLLVHGWGGRAGQLHAFVGPLVSAGFSVVAFDGPAHGASSGRLASMPQLARALVRVARDAAPVHAVIGHSLGAAAIGLACARGMQVARAVLVAPPGAAELWFERFARAVGLSPEAERALRARLEERLGADLAHLRPDRLGRCIHAPSLVVHDKDDRETPWTEGAALAAAAPRAELVLTTGLGHRRILLDAAVVERVVGFVAGRGAAAREEGGAVRVVAPGR